MSTILSVFYVAVSAMPFCRVARRVSPSIPSNHPSIPSILRGRGGGGERRRAVPGGRCGPGDGGHLRGPERGGAGLPEALQVRRAEGQGVHAPVLRVEKRNRGTLPTTVGATTLRS